MIMSKIRYYFVVGGGGVVMAFILLISFSDALLVVSILDILYDTCVEVSF